MSPQGRPSAVARLAQLAAGELSARELVEATVAELRRADATVHAVVTWDDEAALRAADAADAARRAGDHRPLLGLPITVKDCFDVVGLRTSGGSFARPDHVADHDATVVARLRAAGAIPVAKTNVPEACASFETDNAAFGRTNHPLDPAHTPGGSSGGEAALLGADASIVGVGTDGGGSIRVPSHYVGTVGIRPTTGRTPETGVWPATRFSGTTDFTCTGPMARYVEDLALLLPFMAGADGIDPYAVDVLLRAPSAVTVPGLRIGVLETHPHAPTPSAGTLAAVRHAAAVLERLGCRVDGLDPLRVAGAGPSATELFFSAGGADGGAAMRADVAGAGGRHHPQFAALLAAAGAGAGRSAAEFFALQREIHAHRARVRDLFAGVDVILSPVVTGPAPRHGAPPTGVAPEDYLRYEAFEFAHVAAVAGLPAASVPVATEGGLPIGVQIAGAAFREDVVLAVAAAVEAATGGFAINRALAADRPEVVA